ncbi:TrkA-related ion transporter [Caldiplasma sukawensis]
MVNLKNLVENFKKILKQNIGRTLFIAILVIIYSVFSEYLIENPIKSSGIHSLFESLWWTMQTVTTVGYGDVTIVGFYGKLNGIIVMIIGIGTFSFLLVSIAAEIVDAKILKRLGRIRTKMEKHSIICNYTDRYSDLINKLIEMKYPILILGNEESKELKDRGEFIKGNPLNREDLVMAGIKDAVSIIIFPNEKYGSSDPLAVDAESILIIMTAKKIKPEIKVTIELLNESSRIHAVEAGADNVIVRGNMSSSAILTSITRPEAGHFLNSVMISSGEYIIDEKIYRDMIGYELPDVIQKLIDEGKIPLSLYKDGRYENPFTKNLKYNGEILIFLSKAKQR